MCEILLLAIATQQAAVESQTLEQIIPFELTDQNNIAVKALFNQRDQAVLMFHTAVDSVSVTRKAARRIRSLHFDHDARITSWGGRSAPARFSSGNRLQIYRMSWDGIGITEDLLSGRYTDGKFGPNLFDGKVIEINFDARQLRIHSGVPAAVGGYQKFQIKRRDGSMFINATIPVDGREIENDYLIHSGFGGSLLFDDKFAATNKLTAKLSVVGGRELRDSMGNVLKTKKVLVPTLTFGKYQLRNLTAEVFPGAIGRQKMSVVGGDVLRRFNIIIDMRSDDLWLKPVSGR